LKAVLTLKHAFPASFFAQDAEKDFFLPKWDFRAGAVGFDLLFLFSRREFTTTGKDQKTYGSVFA